MGDPAELKDWKDSYRELLEEFESSRRRWDDVEALLRRTASQLAIAAMGQGEALDARLDAVLEHLREGADLAQLRDALSGLGGILKQLPRDKASTAADEQVALLAAELIGQVSKIPALGSSAADLRKLLDRAAANNDWAGLMQGTGDIVAEMVTSIAAQKAELEAFLELVTEQLQQIEAWTQGNQEAEVVRKKDSGEFELTVEREMLGISDEVEVTTDLSDLKAKVQSRLDSVALRLKQFRQSEADREAEAEQRNAALIQEVSTLRERTSDLKKLVEDKENELLFDTLTHVHSRYAYEQRLAEEFHRWQRHGGQLSYALWDLDYFKGINDTYGHDAGDGLLQLVAALINETKRTEDFVARIGGEEFVLLLPMTGQADALIVCERIRLKLADTPFSYQGSVENVTASCGLTEFREGDTPVAVYKRADRALYEAKAGGRNRCISE